jgi:hypothetical protein
MYVTDPLDEPSGRLRRIAKHPDLVTPRFAAVA